MSKSTAAKVVAAAGGKAAPANSASKPAANAKPVEKLVIEEEVDLFGSMLWIPDDTSVFELAKIVQDHIVEATNPKEQFVIVETQGKKKEQKKFLRTLTYDVDKTHMVDLDDLIEMNSLHEAPLLDVLRRRWLKDSMYTFAGEFLVSINPYHQIPGLNDNPLKYLDLTVRTKEEEEDSRSKGNSSPKLPPHVFSIANNALREVCKPLVEGEMESESIIVTGESGAGKTEACKQVMSFLALANKQTFPNAGEQADRIKNVILDSNSIFEAFGNAKTVRNDNSSRFGKYIKLQYTKENQLWAAHTETFLLEKSRLVSVSKDDRNYHIFYQMIRGLDAATKTRLNLPSVETFKILTDGGSTVITTEQDDITEFQAVLKALGEMNCSETETARLWELIAVVLHLGNVVVIPAATEGQQATLESSSIPLAQLAGLLGINADALLRALTIQKVQVKQTNEKYNKILNADEVRNNIGALLKWVYGGLFNWIVGKVNSAHNSLVTSVKKDVVKFIGILDIFGFEIFGLNTFEQLCINYTNERLQQQFNELAFEVEQQEYAKEGLDWTSITYRDNQPVIDLIGKKPKGLLIILEEHSLMNREPDDAALLNTFHKLHFGSHANYAKTKFGNEGFVIKHFAGDVTYNIANFIAKNNDALQDDLSELLSTSSNSFLLNILNNERSDAASSKSEKVGDGGTKIATTISVSLRFRNQLDTLISTLRSTKAFYIKTIKPNGVKKAGVFDAPLVITQLRYSGVLEIVRIRREGYPTRIRYFDFYNDYKELARGRKWTAPDKTPLVQLKEYCKILCSEKAPKKSFQIGKNFLFLHHYVPNIMMTALHNEKTRWATKIQKVFRGFAARKQYQKAKESATKLQSLLRMAAGKKELKKLTVEREETKKKEIEAKKREEEARLKREEEARIKREEEERIKREEEERLAQLKREEEERQRIAEEARLKKEEEDRLRLEEEERVRVQLETLRLEEEKRVRSATVIQSHGRKILIQRAFRKQCSAAKKVQAAAKRYLEDNRNKNLIKSFHALCYNSSNIKDSLKKIKEVYARFPQVYRNKWNEYATMYQTAASGNQLALFKEFNLNIKQMLEPDIKESRLLHYAVQAPDLTTLKYLSNLVDQLKVSLDVNIKEDDEDEEADGNEMLTADAVDLVTGLPILKSGWLRKSSTLLGFKTFKRRWCSLTEESFVLYKGVNKKPAGHIPIEGCVVERVAGNDPLILIKKPGAVAAKKGFFSSESEHSVYTMKAESEVLATEWLKMLQLTAGVRPFRDGPIKHLNLNLRSKWVKLFNKQEQTALHSLASINAEGQQARGDEIVKVAAWLLENGCDLDQKDSHGKTALQYAIDQNNRALVAFLNYRKSAQAETVAPRMSALSRQTMEHQSIVTSAADKPHHLLKSLQSKGFSYLQVYLQSFSFLDKRVVNTLVNPRLKISVVNNHDEPLEAIQTIESPAVVKKDSLYWGYNWYMQTPLESIGDDFSIIIRLEHGPAGQLPAILPVCKYAIDKEKIDSGVVKFNFLPLPSEPLEAPRARGMTLGGAGRKSTLTAAPTVVANFDSFLEGEIELTKLFRNVEIESFA